MRVTGIIAEYDPFHNGHATHIAATRAAGATHVVAVMSGSFTQRGEPSCFSKFARTEMALRGGVDLVLELPLAWAMAPAERFAVGGISLLRALNIVDCISFGSESGDKQRLISLASITDNPAFSDCLKSQLDQGAPYAAAYQKAVCDLLGEDISALLSNPNDTLAVEYIRASQRLTFQPDFLPVLRQGAAHNGTSEGKIASAGFIRELLKNDRTEDGLLYVPPSSAQRIRAEQTQGHAPTDVARLDTALLTKLRSMSKEEIAGLPYVSEGLENRFFQAIRHANSVNQLLEEVKTKRYPLSRLRRILWASLLEIPADMNQSIPPYLRVLGMTEKGKEILSASKPSLPLISRRSQAEELDDRGKAIFRLEEKATDLHALAMPNPAPCGTDRTEKLLCL